MTRMVGTLRSDGRRDFLKLSMMTAVSAWAGKARASAPRVVSLDYGLAQTLIEIGAPPVGLIDTGGWSDWAIEPPLPPGVANLGSSSEVNMELLQLLKPDLILSTPFLEWVRPQMERIAPVRSYAIHAVGSSPYPNIVKATHDLGELVGRPREAEALVARTEAIFAETRKTVAKLAERPVTAISFLDARNIWVYGPGGVFQDVFDRLGLRNGWTKPTNEWGFANAGIADLAGIGDSRLFYMDPVPADVPAMLEGSPLWQSMPFVRAGQAHRIATALMFGTLPALIRFARLLAKAAV
jgi:ABC-type Fe3+-hydroxamate transport system substrate-binding protein